MWRFLISLLESFFHQHTSMMSNSKSYVCPVCGRALSSPGSLGRHLLIHSEDRLSNCAVCGARFTDTNNLNRFCSSLLLLSLALHAHQTFCFKRKSSSNTSVLFMYASIIKKNPKKLLSRQQLFWNVWHEADCRAWGTHKISPAMTDLMKRNLHVAWQHAGFFSCNTFAWQHATTISFLQMLPKLLEIAHMMKSKKPWKAKRRK